MLRVIRQQHPVGHGGFHTGCVHAGDKSIHYIYDCGSKKLRHLKKAVKKYVQTDLAEAAQNVDMLFVSHLDYDHVSGLDELLANVEVKDVFLPYLYAHPCYRILLITEALHDNRLLPSLVFFVADPIGWFLVRGVSRVIWVLGAPGNPVLPERPREQDSPPRLEIPCINGSDDSEETEKIIKEKLDVLRHIPEEEEEEGIPQHFLEAVASSLRKNGSRVAFLDHNRPILLRHATVEWLLLLFVHPEKKQAMARFRKRIMQLIQDVSGDSCSIVSNNPEISGSILKELLASRGLQARLKKCYREIKKEHNLVSMSLYSGLAPASSGFERVFRHLFLCDHFLGLHMCCGSRVGWLQTGDADLKKAKRRKAFLDHYNKLIPEVGVFALPHHGSRYSIDGSLFHKLPVPILSFACAQKGSKHPHLEVAEVAKRHGYVAVVTEEVETGISDVCFFQGNTLHSFMTTRLNRPRRRFGSSAKPNSPL